MARTNTRKQQERARRQRMAALAGGLAVAVVALGGYGALCVAANQDTLLPNTYVLGVNLGGMTRTEAEETIRQQVMQDYQGKQLQITVEDAAVTIPVAQFIQVNGEEAVEQAFAADESVGFLQGGAAYLKALLGENRVDAGDAVTFTGLDQVYDQLTQAIASTDQAAEPTTYTVTDTQLLLTKGISGWAVDQEGLQAAVLAALESGDFDQPVACPLTVTALEEIDLQAVYDAVYTAPEDAKCNEDGSVAAATQGISFDVTTAQAQLALAEEGSQVVVPLIFTDPEVSTETLQALLFRDLLGTASSNVSGSSSRRSNVKKVAEYIDGTILNPGETFSYNEVVGERTEERGFQAAPSYVSGETVDTVGGGVCQGSSTVYLAALRANMEIVERHSHSFLCSYMPYGQDATVSWGTLDFQFRNDTDYPVKVKMSYEDAVLTVSIYGTNLTGNYVEITNQVNSTSSYSTVYQETDTLAAGETQVKTTGYNGMSVTVYRNVYDADGNLLSSVVENNSTYKVRDQVILVGTASAAEESPEPSETPATTETTTEEPAEQPAEAPAEEPAEQPAEAPAEEAAEQPAEAPAEEAVEQPAEAPAEEPVEQPAEAPAEEAVEQPTE